VAELDPMVHRVRQQERTGQVVPGAGLTRVRFQGKERVAEPLSQSVEHHQVCVEVVPARSHKQYPYRSYKT
jgi:hypothetical protein